MFAVYGLIMTVGAFSDENDIWISNFIIGGSFTILTITVFTIGMIMRKKAHVRLEAEIERLFTETGHIEAAAFAKGAGVSMDDARDQLDRRMRERGWHRTELERYNAIYRKSDQA